MGVKRKYPKLSPSVRSKIREEMSRRGVNAEKVAEEVGVHASSIYHALSGKPMRSSTLGLLVGWIQGTGDPGTPVTRPKSRGVALSGAEITQLRALLRREKLTHPKAAKEAGVALSTLDRALAGSRLAHNTAGAIHKWAAARWKPVPGKAVELADVSGGGRNGERSAMSDIPVLREMIEETRKKLRAEIAERAAALEALDL